jgi:mono/diheme cytochrome c family protein
MPAVFFVGGRSIEPLRRERDLMGCRGPREPPVLKATMQTLPTIRQAVAALVLGAALADPVGSTAQDKAPAAADSKLYTVVDGYKVDPNTMNGFRAWRAAACDRCHGANQEGLVGPSLIESLKTLSKEDFVKTVRDGRLEKGMVSFSSSKIVMDNIDNLYAYLKGRSDGAITRPKVEEIKP